MNTEKWQGPETHSGPFRLSVGLKGGTENPFELRARESKGQIQQSVLKEAAETDKMSLHLTWDRALQGLEGHSSTQCQESLVSKTRHMRITVRRERHHFSLWQPWCLLRKELPSARCQLLCNEGEMNYAMTIRQKLYKQDGQTEAMAVFIVGQMPGSTLSQKIPLACSGAGRCLFLLQNSYSCPQT